MKKVTCKLYRFEELSDEVRKKIVEEKTWDVANDVMDFFGDDYQGTLEQFEKFMGIKVRYNVDYCTYDYSFSFTSEPLDNLDEEEICGKLLRRWLNREFIPYVLSPKKYYKYSAGWNGEKHCWNKQRFSKIQIQDWKDCPLTGVCYDYNILGPVFETLSKPIPEYFSLNDLINDCLESFFSTWHGEYEYWCDNKNNCIEEELINRYDEDYFFKDGTKFEGIFEEEVA